MPITQTKIPLSDEWATPIWLFEKIDAEFGFTLDAAAKPWNAKLGRYVSTDGLSADWSGNVVWLNPPYSDIASWLYKARVESRRNGATVVALVPCSPDRHWWHDHVEGVAEVRLLTRALLPTGRVHFQKEDGTTGRAPFASALLIYRPVTQSAGRGPSVADPKPLPPRCQRDGCYRDADEGGVFCSYQCAEKDAAP